MKVYVDKDKLESYDIQPTTDLGGKEFHQVRMWFKDTDNVEILSLADYTKQVRKEVINKVYKVLEQAVPHDLCWSWAVIKKELDKLQD